ncbi:MAG: hypothetical protein SNH88_07635 [Rikenellaceae bacterium]
MSVLKGLVLLLAAFAIACEVDETVNYIDDSYGETGLLTLSDDDQKLTLLRGLAADGLSSIDILVPVKRSNESPAIIIEPDAEEWGEVEFVGKSAFESENFSFYRYRLTSEESLPEALLADSVASLSYSILVSDDEGNALSLPLSVSVIRPAVIFVHGLASNAATYDPMFGYIRPMGLYIEEALYAADYFTTSCASYATNINVVPEAIAYTREALRDRGYVNEKFTLVGHSMGGILTRLYIQNEAVDYPYAGDILKIITIDTPHSGSQLADFALSLGDSESILRIFSSMGAIVDLAVESEATKSLNDSEKLAAANALKIPTHVISAHIGSTMDVAQLVKDKQYLFALTTYLLNAVGQKYIYGDDSSDLVVPTRSQLGGVEDTWRTNYVTTYSNEWHCSVLTTQQTAEGIVELLNTASSDGASFATDGFAPEALSYTSEGGVSLVSSEALPAMSTIESQLLVGVDADGNLLQAVYDDEPSELLALDDESAVVCKIYIARLNSGEIYYNVVDNE